MNLVSLDKIKASIVERKSIKSKIAMDAIDTKKLNNEIIDLFLNHCEKDLGYKYSLRKHSTFSDRKRLLELYGKVCAIGSFEDYLKFVFNKIINHDVDTPGKMFGFVVSNISINEYKYLINRKAKRSENVTILKSRAKRHAEYFNDG